MTNNDKSKLTRRQNFCQLAFIIKTKCVYPKSVIRACYILPIRVYSIT